MTRVSCALALVVAVGCDPVLEEPGDPVVTVVRPAAGDVLRHARGVTVEAELEACDELASVTVFAGGLEVARMDASVTFTDVEWVDDCPRTNGCVFVPVDRILATGRWGPVTLELEAECVGRGFRGSSGNVPITVEPWTYSLPIGLPSAGLVAAPGGGVIAAGGGFVSRIDHRDVIVERQRQFDELGAVLEAAGRLFVAEGCRAPTCRVGGWALTRVAEPGLERLGPSIGLACPPSSMAPGPGEDQVTVISNCPALEVVVASLDLSVRERIAVPAVARGPAEAGNGVVGVLVEDADGKLALLEIDEGAGHRLTTVDVLVADVDRFALAADASWFAVVQDSRQLTFRADGSLVRTRELDLPTLYLSGIPGTDLVLRGDARQGYAIDSTGGLGVVTGVDPHVDFRGAGAAHGVGFGVDGRVGFGRISNNIGVDGVVGPMPTSWRLGATAAGVDGLFHAVYDTGRGAVLFTIDPAELSL